MALDILIVDDEPDIRELIAGVLEDEGYATRCAGDSDEALAAVAERKPSLVLLDVWLRGSTLDGLELLRELKTADGRLPVVMISGHGNLDTAVAAIGHGAIDFIEKPFEAERLLHLVARATETDRLRRENEALRARVGYAEELTGTSSAINGVRATLKRVAGTGSRVLIEGPPGVGKEVAARLLHQWSGRADAPFVIFAATHASSDEAEEELFGIEEDGRVVRPGLLERAHGGTLFVKEVGDLVPSTQARLLRMLGDQRFNRVGGDTPVRVDVRISASTVRDLKEEIADGRFREDLYYRLAVVPVALPPLSERREDIPPLVDHFVARFAAEHRLPPLALAPEAMAALQAADWPGNVRQLRNIVERTIILAPKQDLERIELDMLPPEVLNGDGGGDDSLTALLGSPLRQARENFEREYLRVQIRRFSGNISRTASFIGMERSALHRKLKLLGLTVANRADDGEE